MKKILYFVAFLVVAVCIGSACSEKNNGEKEVVPEYNPEKQYYIAHAGGAIDGYKHTNCLEAMNHAIEKGLTFIELDLLFTSDSVLVAGHDWAWVNMITGCDSVDIAPTYEEFKSRKIYGKYTPVSHKEIVEFFRANPQVFFYTDKVSDYKLIEKYFGEFKNRLCIECFSFEDFKELKLRGYFMPLCSALPTPGWQDTLNTVMSEDTNYPMPYHFVADNVPFEAKHDSLITGVYGKEIANANYALYTLYYCDKKEADRLFKAYPEVKFVYVDDIE